MDILNRDLKTYIEEYKGGLPLKIASKISEFIENTKGVQVTQNQLDELFESQRVLLEIDLEKINILSLKYCISVLLSGKYCQFNIVEEFTEVFYSIEELRFGKSSAGFPEEYQEVFINLGKYWELSVSSTSSQLFQKIKGLLTPFLEKVEGQFLINGDEFLFQVAKADNRQFESIIGVYFKGLELTLNLTRIEHFALHSHEDVIKELILIEKNFTALALDPIDKPLSEAVKAKVSLLIYKVLKRIDVDNISFRIESDKEVLDSEKLISSLPRWKEFITTHYSEGEKAKSAQRKRLRTLQETDPPYYSFEQIHSMVKIFKDDFKSQSKLESVAGKINVYKYTSGFDKYSVRVLRSYIFNNGISLKLNDESLTYPELKLIYDDIKGFQHSDSLQNYHPWLKLSTRIIAFIDYQTNDIINKSLKEEVVEREIASLEVEYNKSVALLEMANAKLKDSFEWSNKRRYLVFQSPFDECLSSYEVELPDIGSFHLFFKSSYVIPISYSETLEMVKNVEVQLHSAKSFHKTYGFLSLLYTKIRESNRELEKNKGLIKQQERRSVEVLGVFSAVAIFSLGSIQMFKDNAPDMTLSTILGFVVAFGFTLTLFIYLIWLITRENLFDLHWYHKAIGLFYFVAFLAMYNYLDNSLVLFLSRLINSI